MTVPRHPQEESPVLENQDRVEQFTTEIADMRLPGTASSRDRTLLRVGVAMMVVGVVIGVVAYFIGHGTTNALQQRDAMVIAVLGLTLAVVGGALFVRYSMAQFLRFWMARLAWEQTAAADRMVEALRNRD